MYTDIRIHSGNLPEFKEMIPENYVSQILRAELTATATYDGEPEAKRLVGISVTGSHAGWMEIVWVFMGPDYAKPSDGSDFVRYLIRRAETSGEYIGVFAEIHMDEGTEFHRNVLLMSGMEITETKNNIYELSLAEVSHERMLYEAARKSDCIFLNEVPEEFLYMLEDQLEKDERAIPVPVEVDWEEYVQELSLICVENDEPVGALLFTEEKDYLVLMLAYSISAKAMSGMIGTALKRARELYEPGKKLLMPIVGRGSREIVERLAPQAKRGDILQAVTWFGKRQVPKSMEYIMRQMMG